MKLFKRFRKNNKGLSLVELVCAVAIFGVITTAVGSAMVVSAQSYSRGTYELDVQQEAQTVTNLVGNLIVSAVEASHDRADASNTVLQLDGEGITYQIRYESENKVLRYTEIDSAGNISEGLLAENVVAFDTNLSSDPDDFSVDRNVEVSLAIEKSGRTYEATYSTTARNGSADAVGAAESAQIMVESEIVLEPGQTYLLPVTVVGSVTNKAIKVTKGEADAPVTLSAGTSYVSVTVGTNASGIIPFSISTIETDDETGLPLDTKTVNIKVRRVNSLSGVAVATGTEYMSGTSYKVNFTVNGDYLDKVYGKDYDTDYVNPRQVSITYTMTGMEDGYTIDDYIDASTVSFVYTDSPYMSFKLKQDMPYGSVISVTATALHSNGTNKTGIAYASGITYTVEIKRPNNWINLSSELRRGSDGIEVLINSSYMSNLISEYGNNFKKYYRVYEVNYNADGTEASRSGVCFESEMIDSGSVTMIRGAESKRLKPDQDYILEMYVMFYDSDGTVVWPIVGETPKEDYCCEYPLDAASVVFYYQTDEGKGYSTSPYSMTAGSEDYSISMNFSGLEMSKYAKDYASFVVEEFDEATGWTESTSSYDVRVMNGSSDGDVSTFFLFRQTGRYRVKVILKDIPYNTYSGADATGTFELYDEDTGEGIFYVTVS